MITEKRVGEVLPLADEYDVKCIRQKREEWLLTELEFRIAEVSPHYVDVESNVKYLIKCVHYGEKYTLRKLYHTAFKNLTPFQLRRYIKDKQYKILSEKTKRDLLEKRLCEIEENILRKKGYFGTPILTYTKGTDLSVSSDMFK